MFKGFLKGERLVFLALAFHLFLLLGLGFTAWPEMLAWPYLILKGWLPYRDIAIAHTPLLLADLTVFNKIFGVGLWQLKAYTWILILISDYFVYFVARRFWDKKTTLVALLFYIPFQLFYEGNGLWFDLALAPLVLAAYYSLKKENYLWAGVWLGVSIMTKQTAIWFLVPAAWMVYSKKSSELLSRLTLFLEGFFTAVVPVFLLASILKILPNLIEWTVNFGIFYLPKAPGQILLPTFRQLASSFFPFLILLPIILQKERKYLEVAVWALVGVLGVYPRFELFHFQPAIPFLAIGAATIYSRAPKKVSVNWSTIILWGYLVLTLVLVGKFVIREWKMGDRFFDPDVLQVSSLIINYQPSTVFILNYWDSIYALSGTIPATKPLVPYLPWYLEYKNLKGQIAKDLILNKPDIIVKGIYQESGLGSYKVTEIDALIARYYHSQDQIDGVEIYVLNK